MNLPTIELRPATADDAALLHWWGQASHVSPWWDLGTTVDDAAAHLCHQAALAHLTPWVASADGRPIGYVETYLAAQDPLADHYPAQPGDRGWHVLVGEADVLGTEVTRRLGRHVMARLLSDAGSQRVVCEPDIRNERMVRYCQAIGHQQVAVLDLPDKTAVLMACTRERFDSLRSADEPEGMAR